MGSMGLRIIILCTAFAAFTAIHAFPPEGYGPIGQRRCFQPVRIEIPECQNTFYNFTGLPNLVGQESQVDARHQLQTFKPLITYKCSNQLAFFLCSVYAPMCDVNTHHLIGPCRPLCERVRKRCSPVLRIFDFDWPANLNCSRFPERNTVGGAMCMEGPEAGEDEAEDADTPAVDVPSPPSESEGAKAEWPWPSQKASSATGASEEKERAIIPAEGIIRQIEDLPEAANMDLSKLGPQLQHWLARLNQNPLSTFFGTNEIPVALLVSSLRFCSHLYKPTSYIFINRTGRCAPHCSADILFSQNAKTLATVWTSVISGLCLLATTLALLSYAIHPSLFHPLERPVIYIAGCQLAYALGFALRLKLGREAVACGVDPASGYSIRLQEGLENSNCALVFLIQYYFFVAGAIWWAMMVVGWTRRTSYAYRLMRNPCRRDSASVYVAPKSPCCCCLGRATRGETPFVFEEAGAFMEGESGVEGNRPHPNGVNPTAGAQPAATTSSLRASHVNRRIQTASSNSIDLNCLAKEHVIAWLTPGLLTVAVLVTRQVDADELLGICSVGRQNTRTMLIFMLVPQFFFLLLGLVAFVVCTVYLHRLGRLTAQASKSCGDGVLAPSATMSNLDAPPGRCLAFQSDLDPNYEDVSTSESASGCFSSGQLCCGCCPRSLRWDGISIRLGFFTLLYIVPAISIFVCDFYEFLFRDAWLAGDPSTAVTSLLQTHAQPRGRITPEIFLLRTFMSLVTGLATCLWLLSIKGIEPWRHLARQIESRCARSGYFCFSTLGLKTPAAVGAGASGRPLPPDPNSQTYAAKTKEQQQQHQGAGDPCSPHNPSTSSTVLHPYAVYQHRCSSGKSDGLAHCDNNQERYHAQVLLASRPPAGPGLDAGDQFFLPSQAASGGTLTSVSSPTQASGYYSSATNNSGGPTRGGGGGGRPFPAPCPPPNTPPLPPFGGVGGGRSDPKVPHGSVASSSQQYPDWWGGPNGGVKGNFNGPQNRQAAIL